MSDEFTYWRCECCGARIAVPATTPPTCGHGHERGPMVRVSLAEYHEGFIDAPRDPRRSED